MRKFKVKYAVMHEEIINAENYADAYSIAEDEIKGSNPNLKILDVSWCD